MSVLASPCSTELSQIPQLELCFISSFNHFGYLWERNRTQINNNLLSQMTERNNMALSLRIVLLKAAVFKSYRDI